MNPNPQETANENSIVVCPDGNTVALCRCGASAIKPYSDGTHKLIGFRTEIPGGPGK
ncbi:CDGSH iron-sulfur domain-containing protein [Arthrobacter sp. S2(2024)]|uniref:CDGSH iron-sulfur domain-containing protein n=1 Tax=Arthrobacter sp. S2(2024) TaxID=3111911 RepID=UPI002FC9B93A